MNIKDPRGSMEAPFRARSYASTDISAADMDSLVSAAVHHIAICGERIEARAGSARQAYGVTYVLTNPLDRLHLGRAGAVRYLCRELIAYFNGSLAVADGLTHASAFWKTLQDEEGRINSNYGHYVFHAPVENYGSQYNWAVEMLSRNLDSRRAVININQAYHKSETLDFPCTLGVQFYVRAGEFVAEVLARSTDSVTGLPYDLGFFSFLHELLFRDLVERGHGRLSLGPTVLRASFTQIYDRTAKKAFECLAAHPIAIGARERMPAISSAADTLRDILSGSAETEVVDWITHHAE